MNCHHRAHRHSTFMRLRMAPCLHARARQMRPARQPAMHVHANLFSKLFGGGSSAEAPAGGAAQQKQAAAEVFIMAQNQADPEFPPYTVVKRGAKYDLRLYDVYPIIEMQYTRREEGYAYLGAYIDGENSAGTKFNYSQPVIMRYYPSGTKVMQMFLGSRRLADGTSLPGASAAEALTALPAPERSDVAVSVAGGELVAVRKFDGYITPPAAEQQRQYLMTALQQDGLQLADEEAAGYFRCAQYGAVYQLAGRLNEMMLRVKA